MNDFEKQWQEAKDHVWSRARQADIADSTAKDFVIREFAIGIERRDWCLQSAVLGMVYSNNNPEVKAEILNVLLLTPGHFFHQEITREIQSLRHPSSVWHIDKLLSEGFGMLEYTGSEDAAIAKWFSHALADIGTSEAIQTIRKFALSPNKEISKEMKYRLQRIAEYGREGFRSFDNGD